MFYLQKGREGKLDIASLEQLYIAIKERDIAKVKDFIEVQKVNIHVVDEKGESPVIHACDVGCGEILELLHKAGADINYPNDNGASPAYIAAEVNQLEILIKLKELGADLRVANKNNSNPVYIAALCGHLQIITKLKEYGVPLDQANRQGVTPLSIAAERDFPDIIEELHAGGADVNKSDNDYITPLYSAAENGNIASLQMLLKLGADVKKARRLIVEKCRITGVNRYPCIITPLYAAVSNGHIEAVKILARTGIDLDTKSDYRGLTAAELAYQKNNIDAIKSLASWNADMQIILDKRAKGSQNREEIHIVLDIAMSTREKLHESLLGSQKEKYSQRAGILIGEIISHLFAEDEVKQLIEKRNHSDSEIERDEIIYNSVTAILAKFAAYREGMFLGNLFPELVDLVGDYGFKIDMDLSSMSSLLFSKWSVRGCVNDLCQQVAKESVLRDNKVEESDSKEVPHIEQRITDQILSETKQTKDCSASL